MIGRGLLAVALALAAVLIGVAPANAEQTGAQAAKCDPAKGSLRVAESWAQQRFDLRRIWPLTNGAGVTVGIVDSGVDLTHPQLQVAKSLDFTGTGYRDCLGHGTAVAGIIAGRYITGVPYYGVAPAARLISLKQTNTENGGDVRILARAIEKAADLKVGVLNVSVQAQDRPELMAAVRYALDRDVVIVAAAGNVRKEDGTPAPAFPAAYDGVLAVGSATSDGTRADSSNTATPVAVLGPGKDITSTWTGRTYMSGLEGTSFAAPYVAGVAALVRSRFPRLNQEQVRWRITTTADGAAGAGTGAGMVNPLLAVTTVLPVEGTAPLIAPPSAAPLPADAVSKVPPVDQRAIGVASAVAAGALCLVALIVAGRFVVLMGRRRGERTGDPNSSPR
ncbi:MAG TPA: S8 family serine peptidase [Thermopolyspora sp.]